MASIELNCIRRATAVPAPEQIDTSPLRWHGLGPVQTPWYATIAFQGPLMLLFIGLFLAGLIVSINPWALFPENQFGQWPRLVMGLTNLVNLHLMAGLLNAIGFLAFADANGAGPQIPYSELLPVLAGITLALTASLALFAAVSQPVRVSGMYRTALVTAVAYIPYLIYWKILGPPLGS